MKAFIAFHFCYCPLLWMFYSGRLNSPVNKLYERTLRIVYQDYTSSFTALLELDNPTSVHNRNIQLENAQHYYDLGKKLNLREITLKRCTTELKL